MMPKRSWIILMGLAFFLMLYPANASPRPWTLVGVSWYADPSSPLVAINPTNGVGSVIGLTGFNYLNSLARDKSGNLYSARGNQLIRINPATGAGTVVANLNFELDQSMGLDIRGLAFSPDGVLYAIQRDLDRPAWDYRYFLYWVSVATGVGTKVSSFSTGLGAMVSITFSSGGTLYGWDGTAGLVTIDRTTGLATDVNPSQGGTLNIQSIVFGPDGNLYGACNNLYKINTSTGVWTHVGGGYNDLRGLEAMPPKSPEVPGILMNLLSN
jgi:hypothetical protein